MEQVKEYYLYYKEFPVANFEIVNNDDEMIKYGFSLMDFDKVKEKYLFAGEGCADFLLQVDEFMSKNEEERRQRSYTVPTFLYGMLNSIAKRQDILEKANIKKYENLDVVFDKLANIDLHYGEFTFSNKAPESMPKNADTPNM